MLETILYRNWRGEVSVRKIKIDALAYGNEALGLHFCSNEWHPEEQWILFAHDVEKDARRGFALSGILAWGEQAIANRSTALATAVARARREALEEAAKVARARAATCKAAAGEWLGPVDVDGTDPEMAACMSAAMDQCEQVADEILALRAATPPEARQTETGWKTPAGWKLVPVEPTEEMVSATWMKTGDRARYSAMLAASPPPPAIGNLEGEGRS